MKNTAIYIILLSLFGLVSCHDMDEPYKEYIIPGGIIYPQKAGSLAAFPGKNRVQIRWEKPTDPSVTNARIYWNNYTDSVAVDLVVAQSGDLISQIVDNLPENTYTFHVRTYDKDGHVSVPSEVMGKTYGDIYQASLLPRSISFMYVNQGELNIQWGVANASETKVLIKYVSSSGNVSEKIVAPNETTTVVPDIQTGSAFTVGTCYLPEPFAIDEFVVTEEYTAE
jgi:hypothetical protein